MRHPRLIPVLLLIIITSLATPLQAQIVLKGKITTEKNEPVAFAPVILQQLPDTTRYTEGVITDMAGNYRFGKHRAGRYLLSVRTIGYKTLYDTVLLRKPSIGMTEVVRDYVLSEDVAEIDAVVVTANNTASYFDRTVYTITNEDRNVNFLKEIVNRIYAAMIRTEYMVYEMYPQIKPCLPQKLHFIHSEELRQLYPDLEPKCREHAICQKYGAVFIIGIGCKLSDGKKHDGRAPDYDDYTTKGLNDLPGLNGDLLLWDNVLQRSIELSSMGIRVDKEALQRQLKEEKEEKRLELYFHKRLMNDTLPLSIGGGIGQSRLCMFYLRKAHIGEIQASIWPEDMRKECEELEIHLI